METFNIKKKLTTREVQLIELDMLKEFIKICEANKITWYMGYGTLLGAVREKGFIPWDDDFDILMPRKDYDRFCDIALRVLPKDLSLQNCRTNKHYFYGGSFLCKEGTYTCAKCFQHLKIHKGIYLDIFPIDNISSSNVQKKNYCNRVKKIDALIILRQRKDVFKKSDDGWNAKLKYMKNWILRHLLLVIPISLLTGIREKEVRKYNNIDTKLYVSSVMPYKADKEILRKSWFKEVVYFEFEGMKLPAFIGWHEYLRNLYGNYMIPPAKKDQHGHSVAYLLKKREG